MDLITVIVPVYNVEKYLMQCVESIINQSYKNLEIILVDDGSTDGSGKLCDVLKEKDKRIVVIHKSNAGLGYARNSGLQLATGKYVTFVDSDDYIGKTLIEQLYNALKENMVDECKMGFARVDDAGVEHARKEYDFELFKNNEAASIYLPRLIGSSPKGHDSIEMCVCGTLFNNSLIQKHNILFPSEREFISEDLIFQFEYLQFAKGACTIRNCEYMYRINATSLTQKYNSQRFEKNYKLYQELKNRLQKKGYGPKEINRCKKMFFVYLRSCISQEVMNSNLKFNQKITNLRKICKDKRVVEVIESYPINELSPPQYIFLKLVCYKMVLLLYVLKKVKLY